MFCLCTTLAFSQKRQKELADNFFESGEYFSAIEKYKLVYGKVRTERSKSAAAFKIGECYRKINKPELALNWYKEAAENEYSPKAVLYYAEMLKMTEDYETAAEQYAIYQELMPDDKQGENGIKACQLAPLWKKKPTRHKIKNIKEFNTKENDYCPIFTDTSYNEIIFTSSREGAAGTLFYEAAGQTSSDLFLANSDRKNKWSIPTPLLGEINSEYDEGAASILQNENVIFYTICKIEEKKKLGCHIYAADKKDQKYLNIREIKLTEDSSVTVAHPSISSDGLKLYFVSDMEGGKGGKDIWLVERADLKSEWSRPKNMGSSINTSGDEMFPYVRNDSMFYFSSNFHAGMGGLDIFKAKLKKDKTWKVENMKYPINSSADDFGIVFEKNKEKGFFSSSREDGKGGDDIYSFFLPALKFKLRGTVLDEETGKIIAKAKVKLTGNDGTTLEAKSNSKGKFSFRLKEETTYDLVSEKTDYLNGRGQESTNGLEKSTTLHIELFMVPITKPIELPNIEYDLNRWNLRPESMVSLDRLVETLDDNPNITIELGAHTDFRGSDDFNLELSQKRAESVVQYLISKGISPKRLVAKGYGETNPKKTDEKIEKRYPFLKKETVLNQEFIESLKDEEEIETAHQLNRRTEFRVLSTDFFEMPPKDENSDNSENEEENKKEEEDKE